MILRAAFCLALAVALAGCGGGVFPTRDSDGACGIPGLVAEPRESVQGPGACGIARPVTVTRVAGVDLSRPSYMTCGTARALDLWVRGAALPAVGRRGGGLVELQVAAHYACRTRNSRRGARLSEHAKGKAIDISALNFADGSRVMVLEGWNGSEADRRLLRRLHRAACGPFGTVLGPNSDRHHRDHFHFDTAEHRGGPYCR